MLWLCVYARPHLLCRTMFDAYLLLIDIVFNEKILYLKVLRLLRTACLSIDLEQDSTHVVLVEQGSIHVISLLYHKYPAQRIYPNVSSTPTSSASVELFVLIFCFQE